MLQFDGTVVATWGVVAGWDNVAGGDMVDSRPVTELQQQIIAS